jgi:hypothetical protein
VLSEREMEEVLAQESSWLFLLENGGCAQSMGSRALPPKG